MRATTSSCIFRGMSTTGKRIASAREEKGWNQSELARQLGVKPQSVQAWESGRNVPRPQKMQQISHILGKSVGYLMGDEAGSTGSNVDLEPGPLVPAVDNPKEAAAAAVMAMLQKHRNGLSAAAQQQIADAVAGSLAESELPAGPKSNVVTANFSRVARIADGDILIPQYDVRAAMGNGQVPADYVEFVRNIIVSGPQLEKMGLDYTSPANLSIITGWGQSMEGTINDKDPVVVDRGVNEFVGDGVYVITWEGHLFIKRLQLYGKNQIELISDNPNHNNRTVSMDDVTIHAKVLLVWNAKKL